MNYNRIPVTFDGTRRGRAPEINYQYDIRQVLVIQGLYNLPDTFVVDFCNEGDSSTKPVVGTPDGIEIPDEYLKTGKTIKAYMIVNGAGEAVQTRYELTIPVRRRPERTDIEPTPAERSTIDQLIDELNTGVTRAEDAAESAEADREKAEAAQEAAEAAQAGAEKAKEDAEEAEGDAAASAKEAASYAHGGTGTRTGEDTDNAKYYKEQTEAAAAQALKDIGDAKTEAVSEVTGEGTAQKNAVTAEGTAQVSRVETAGSTQISAINTAGEKYVADTKSNADAAAKSASVADASQKAAAESEVSAKTAQEKAESAQEAAEESEANAKESEDVAALSAEAAKKAAESMASLNFTDFDTGETYGYGLGIKGGYPALKLYVNETEG